jgi:hypothetical protein
MVKLAAAANKHQENMTTNKDLNFIKVSISYLTLVSIVTSIAILIKVDEVIGNFNLFFITILLVNIFVMAVDLFFLFRKKAEKDYKLVLLINVIYSLISGFEVRGGGYIISNNLGSDLSIYFKKNWGGVDYGFHYDTFNLIIKLFFYDNNKSPQFSVQVNLIMLTISFFLIFYYNVMRKTGFSLPTAHPSVTSG